MKKSKKALMTAAAFAAALNFTGCHEDYQAVYGPPPDENVTTSTTTESEIPTSEEEKTTAEKTTAENNEFSENSESEDTTVPMPYDPEMDRTVALYAPPDFWD